MQSFALLFYACSILTVIVFSIFIGVGVVVWIGCLAHDGGHYFIGVCPNLVLTYKSEYCPQGSSCRILHRIPHVELPSSLIPAPIYLDCVGCLQ